MLNDAPRSRTGSVAGSTPVPTGQGRVHSLMLLKQLADATAEHNFAADIDTIMAQALHVGLLVVILDFLGSLDWARPLCATSALTEVVAIRLVDPANEALPGEGSMVMAGSVIGEITELNINDKTRIGYAT